MNPDLKKIGTSSDQSWQLGLMKPDKKFPEETLMHLGALAGEHKASLLNFPFLEKMVFKKAVFMLLLSHTLNRYDRLTVYLRARRCV